MREIRRSTALRSSAALIALFVHQELSAQNAASSPPAADQGVDGSPGDNQLSEIVVTANRRSESISRVPISVSAFGSEEMATMDVKDVSDLGRISPGLTFRPSSFGGSTNISIRGITSNVGASTTGVYIDDTPIQARIIGTAQSSGGTYPTIFDLERVEVLRGPQGTLFGSGSEGGTVRFITPSPSLGGTSGYARSELSFTEHGAPSYEVGAALGDSIVPDELGFRVSAYFRRDGGWIDRTPFAPDQPSADNSNYTDTSALRGALTLAPRENLKITASMAYQRIYSNDMDLNWLNLSNFSAGDYRNGFTAKQPTWDSFSLPSLKVEFDFGSASLFSNTAYFDRQTRMQRDYSTFVLDTFTPIAPGYTGPSYFYAPVPNFTPISYNFAGQKSFSQEVRLQSNDSSARLTWVGGLFFQHSKQSFDQYVYSTQLDQVSEGLFGAPAQAVFGVPPLPPGYYGVPQGAGYLFIGREHTLDEQYAAFGQADLRLTDTLKITAGLRAARDKFAFSILKNGAANGGLLTSDGEKEETPVTPKFGLNYEPIIGELYYLNASKGFRTGGANPPVTNLCSADLTTLGRSNVPPTYNSDHVWSYELGTKDRFLDNRVQLEASAFLIDWSNIQQEVKLGSCGFDFIANVGKALSTGFDVELTVKPTRGLSLSASASYTDARYTETAYGGANNAGLLVSRGDRLAIPPWHATAAADYDFPFSTGLDGYLHGDYEFESRYQALPRAPSISADPLIDSAEETRFATARAGVRKGSLDTSLFVSNLFNSHDELFLTRNDIYSGLLKAATYRPRTIGLTVSYHY
jgi:outer membrane receptor protein involved in Fe transport